jgi:hypothetical protein
MLYAWCAQAPHEGLDWIRATWPTFVELEWEHVAIRSLQNLRGAPVDPAVVDLVLEKVGPDAPPRMLKEAARCLEGRRGHRDDEIDALLRSALAHDDDTVKDFAIAALDHPGRADQTDLLLPLLALLDTAEPSDGAHVHALLKAIRHQPIENVEPVLVDILLDANALPDLRASAAAGLFGRLSPAGRARLLDWLTSSAADEEVVDVSLAAAWVVGTDGGAQVAERCLAALRRLLFEAYDEPLELDPEVPSANEAGWQIGVLSRAIAFTEDEPSLEAVLELVFDERFARFARRAVEQHGRRLGPVDASAGAATGPGLYTLWHRSDGLYAPLPWEITLILENLKPFPDERLAPMFERRLAELRRTGRLAAFPDLYLDRVIAYLRDRFTGDHLRSARAVERWVGPTEPVGGAADFNVARDRVERRARAGRFEGAAAAQAEALAILSRRAYDDENVWLWRVQRGALDAWQAAALKRASDDAGAEALLQGAVARNFYTTQVLQTVSMARARAGLNLQLAVALAERAATLELRVLDELTPETADTLAYVRLQSGEADAAYAAIEPILRRIEQRSGGGRFHLRAAQALVAAGDTVGAADAVLKALGLEPSLDEEMRKDPRLAPLAESGKLEALIREAERKALWSIFD